MYILKSVLLKKSKYLLNNEFLSLEMTIKLVKL